MKGMNRWVVAAVLAGGLMGCGAGDHVDEYSAGQGAEGRGDVKGAIADYRKAPATDDRSLYRLGTLEMDQKQYADAAAAWEKFRRGDFALLSESVEPNLALA